MTSTAEALRPILDHCEVNGLDIAEFLRKEHWGKEKHLKYMADEWGVGRMALTRFMDRIGVGHRTMSEAQLIIAKNPSEKARKARTRWQRAGVEWMQSEEGRKFNSERNKGDRNPAKKPGVGAKISAAKMGERNWMYGRYGSLNPAWQGGCYRYVRAFEQTRPEILERDNYTCQLCGEPGDNVHHINYERLNNDPGNLITLCHKHHMGTNNGDKNRASWQAYFEGFMMEEGFAFQGAF